MELYSQTLSLRTSEDSPPRIYREFSETGQNGKPFLSFGDGGFVGCRIVDLERACFAISSVGFFGDDKFYGVRSIICLPVKEGRAPCEQVARLKCGCRCGT